LLDLAPRCASQAKYGRPCLACGLTRGFWLISHGRFEQGAELNPASPAVYAVFVGNGVIALLYWRRYWRGKPPVNQRQGR